MKTLSADLLERIIEVNEAVPPHFQSPTAAYAVYTMARELLANRKAPDTIALLTPYLHHDDGCACGSGAECTCGMQQALSQLGRAP